MNSNEEYLRNAVKNSAAKIVDCNVFLSIVTPSYIDDPYCAMQLGLAILMDKPIRLLVKEGTILPENLKKLAERISYYETFDDLGLASERLLKE